jgi:site-specific DNA-methyltransferase (adenine-specific)
MGGVEGRHRCESNEIAKTMTLSPVLYSSRSEEWETPQDLFDELHREFAFTLDACATSANAKCKRFFDKRRDGLKQDWTGERVFMNPPYGKEIGRWMNKARTEAEKGVLVVCLVHARTDTRWWHENVEGAANQVRFIRGRLRFGRAGVPSLPAPFPSAIVVYRHQVRGIR